MRLIDMVCFGLSWRILCVCVCVSFLESHQFTWLTVNLFSVIKCRLTIILKIISYIIELINSISKESCFFRSPGRKM